ncbi:hypothetical protein T12_8458 [Trichinella patagoniensis]|uniref:Uncharacterized protein n=1 Tax=Trichinella patagoniensis TaxID=990121 RepID=A0A0V0XVE3_9BILA|nr:hypothetical protein T12_8458 [Trichinella patagoniensis]
MTLSISWRRILLAYHTAAHGKYRTAYAYAAV